MIHRDDPQFREKVLRFFNPTTIEDYHNSVLTEDVRHNCPDLYEIHIRPYLPEPSPVIDAMSRRLGKVMREALDAEIWRMLNPNGESVIMSPEPNLNKGPFDTGGLT